MKIQSVILLTIDEFTPVLVQSKEISDKPIVVVSDSPLKNIV